MAPRRRRGAPVPVRSIEAVLARAREMLLAEYPAYGQMEERLRPFNRPGIAEAARAHMMESITFAVLDDVGADD